MQTAAIYFDGTSTRAHKATVQLFQSMGQVNIDGQSYSFDSQSCRVVPPVGRGKWIIELPENAQLQFDDHEFGLELVKQFGENMVVDRMERSWRWAIITLLVAVVGVWAILTFGVPVGAKYIALTMPDEIDEEMGRQSMDVLDRLMFDDTELSTDQRDKVQALFRKIKTDTNSPGYYRLEFRASPAIGANAFAVPGGLVVMTDEMVGLAETDEELIAVLAHEVGHLQNKHSLRILLQNSVSAIMIAGLTGDLSNITALSATIPTVLMQAKYSRDFEREADDFAFDYLEVHSLDSDALSRLLMRLEGEAGLTANSGVNSWLSSHPRSTKRKPDDD